MHLILFGFLMGLLNGLFLFALVGYFLVPIKDTLYTVSKKVSKKRKGYIFEPNEEFDNLMDKLESNKKL